MINIETKKPVFNQSFATEKQPTILMVAEKPSIA